MRGIGKVMFGRSADRDGRRRRRLVVVAVAVVGVASALTIATALADNPTGSGFTIDGNIPDPGTVSFPDPVGSVKELGPANGSSTKVGVINTADTKMMDVRWNRGCCRIMDASS